VRRSVGRVHRNNPDGTGHETVATGLRNAVGMRFFPGTDDLWVSVGSTNFDNRSFRLNDEANLNVYDADFARRQVKDFEEDRKRAHRVTLAEWQHRPLSEKILEHAAGLLRSQL